MLRRTVALASIVGAAACAGASAAPASRAEPAAPAAPARVLAVAPSTLAPLGLPDVRRAPLVHVRADSLDRACFEIDRSATRVRLVCGARELTLPLVAAARVLARANVRGWEPAFAAFVAEGHVCAPGRTCAACAVRIDDALARRIAGAPR